MSIRDDMTLAELRALPMDEAVAALRPNYVAPNTSRIGPFGNVGFRPMHFEGIGTTIPVHTHNFDHAMFIARGAVNVWAQEVDARVTDIVGPDDEESGYIEREIKFIGDPIERQFKAPSVVLIKKNWAHKFTCLEAPAWVTCVFALRDHAGEVVDYWDGNDTYWK